MEQWKIERINELARKSREHALTEQEKEEQAKLRKEYIENIRRNFRRTLESIEWVDEK